MTATKPLVIVTRKLPDEIEVRLKELFDARLNEDDVALTREQLAEAMQTAAVLVPTVTDRLDRDLLARAGDQLKLIANFGTGVDNIDLAAAKQQGLTITNTPGVLTEDTADMAMALILAVPRRLAEGERVLRDGAWPGWSPTWMLGRRIWGKRLGIVGMGRIGSAIARRARGFGLAIHYHNRRRAHPELEAGLEATYWESLDQMLRHVDIVSINCPLTPATHGLLSRERLQLLREHAYLVNTSRGEIVDEDALGELLEAGAIAGAGLDVFAHAPAVNPRLLKLDNVVLLPHMGSATIEGRCAMGEKVVVNIKMFVDGHTPPDRVLETLL